MFLVTSNSKSMGLLISHEPTVLLSLVSSAILVLTNEKRV